MKETELQLESEGKTHITSCKQPLLTTVCPLENFPGKAAFRRA